MRRKGDSGLFAGVREVVDQALGVNDFATKSAALELTKRGFGVETATLVPNLYELIQRNWNAAVQIGRRSHSEKNFRWHCPQTYIADSGEGGQ